MTEFRNHIEANPEIMFEKPCIKGTRVPVDLILEKLSSGWSYEDLLDAYPRLKKEDILACIKFEKIDNNLDNLNDEARREHEELKEVFLRHSKHLLGNKL